MTNDALKHAYGDPALAPPACETLQAGPLSITFTAQGDLRYIRFGNHELIRRVYAAVRAADWWTVPVSCVIREKTVGTDSFRIVYEAQYVGEKRGIDLRAVVTLTGDSEGRITFDFDAEAFSEFDRKRIGICVLHPASTQGTDCVAVLTDGSEESGKLPDTISPHQPFFDLKAFRHTAAPGIETTVEYSGDIFEMEDQRNWLDASFKTYSTPLALPTPVTVPKGERIRQTVTVILALSKEAATETWKGATPMLPVSREALAAIPSVGLTWFEELTRPGWSLPLSSTGHIWQELDLAQPRWQYLLRRADAAAERYSVSLYVCLKNAITYAKKKRPVPLPGTRSSVRWFAAGVTETADINAVKELIAGMALSVGFLGNFTDLNRTRPDMSRADSVFYSIGPQVHANDSLSIEETPPTILDTVRTARTFAAGKPNHLGPVAFGGSGDPRETATFGKNWYKQTLAYAATAKVDSVTFHKNAIPALRELMMEGKET